MVEEMTRIDQISGEQSLALPSRHTLFIGRGDYAIDDKGRLTLPVHMRPPLADGGVLSPMDGRAAIWARWTFDLAAAELRTLVQKNELPLDYVSSFLHTAAPISPDAQGRIVIPPAARMECGLERDVLVLGSGPRIEIVAAATDELDRLQGVDDSVVDALARAGF